ncbi:MAG: hypothetical protein HYY96_10870 [Candidatus Tectomicrobia bacterium]|nr:hypothetical protein [Candidatus Tectomicrobia bacterium]
MPQPAACRLLALLVALWLPAWPALAQLPLPGPQPDASSQAPAALTGRVFNALTLVGIPLARVRVEPLGASVSTDVDGTFSLAVPPGSYEVLIEQEADLPAPPLGYALRTRLPRVRVDEAATHLEVFLTPLFSAELTAPPEPLTLIPARATLRLGEEQTFRANGGSGLYLWRVSSGSLDVDRGAVARYTAPASAGSHAVILSDSAGNVTTAQVQVTNTLFITPLRATLRQGEEKAFTAIGGIPPYSWASSAGDILAASGASVTYTAPRQSGSHTLTVTDAASSQAEATVETILPLSITPASAAVELEGSAEFAVAGGVAPFSVRATAGTVSGPTEEGTITFAAPNLVGNQSLIVTDSAGNNVSALISVSRGRIRVSPASAAVEPGEALRLSALGGSAPYRWGAEAGSLSAALAEEEEPIIYIAPILAGLFNVTVTDSAGSEALISINVAQPLAVTPQSATLGLAEEHLFLASGGSGTYTWSASEGDLSSTQGSEIRYTAPASRSISSLILTDSAGNSAVATITTSQGLRITPATVALGPSQESTFSLAGGVPPYILQTEAGQLSASTVEENQLFTHSAAVFPGRYKLRATDREGTRAEAEVEVVPPTLTLAPSETRLRAGDTLTLAVTTSGRGNVDLYVGLLLPSGQLLSLAAENQFHEAGEVRPLRSNEEISGEQTLRAFSLAVPALPEELRGDYRVVALLTAPGRDPLRLANHLAVATLTLTLD